MIARCLLLSLFVALPALAAPSSPPSSAAASGAAPGAIAALPDAPAVDMSADIRDVHDVAEPPMRGAPPLAAIAAVLVAAVVIASVAFVLVRRRARRNQLPHEVARRRLRAADALADEATASEFCTAVSTAIRAYVDDAFGIRAPRRTTEELLRELIDDPAGRFTAQRARLEELLMYCDLAKFARCQLTRVRLVAMRESAEGFVDETALAAPTTVTQGAK